MSLQASTLTVLDGNGLRHLVGLLSPCPAHLGQTHGLHVQERRMRAEEGLKDKRSDLTQARAMAGKQTQVQPEL